MRINIHLGAHCTDDERLLRCLRNNAEMLDHSGTCIPDPDLYRTLLRDTAAALQGKPASPETEEMVLDQILDEADIPDVVVLSWDNFMSFPQWALRGRLYPAAADRVRGLMQIFPSAEVTFYLAIRNPATFLPELCSRQRQKTPAEVMSECDPVSLRWSDTIGDVVARNPGVNLVIWADEDAPLIWPEVLAHVGGIDDGSTLTGWDDLLSHLMEDEGMRRLHSTLAEPPQPDVRHRREIISNLLGEFVRPEAVEVEFEMPGWDQALVDHMTATYEDDMARIAALPGVRFLTP
ncbi:hypothetical protein [Falsirhodobacter sp. alg1]|uniref:hypothetical protein n=1 Tax=Falsirhodobacter sp. alg1 TaxID=1472418 RepID=UPI00128ED80B|nr:hypothetical protein [Falsirhodobacter sp. alg1]